MQRDALIRGVRPKHIHINNPNMSNREIGSNPRSYADAMKAQAPHFYSSRQRKKPKGRMFPRYWLDSLQTAHRLLNNRQS